MYNKQYTVHRISKIVFTLHFTSLHFTLDNTTIYKLNTFHYKVHTTHYTVPTTHHKVPNTHYTTLQYTLYSAHYTLYSEQPNEMTGDGRCPGQDGWGCQVCQYCTPLLYCTVLSPYLDERGGVQGNTSMRSRVSSLRKTESVLENTLVK